MDIYTSKSGEESEVVGYLEAECSDNTTIGGVTRTETVAITGSFTENLTYVDESPIGFPAFEVT